MNILDEIQSKNLRIELPAFLEIFLDTTIFTFYLAVILF